MTPRLIPVALLLLSPLNPADRSNSDLTTLIEGIHRDGLLSALTVRPHLSEEGKFEVVCGERRTRSLQALIEAGRMPATYAAPCLVREGLSNAEMVLLAMEENLAREAMTPLDELRAVASAREQGASLDTIAARLNTTPLKIERRIAVLERGSSDLKEAIRVAKVTLAQAAAIVAAPVALHPALLGRALEGASAAALVALGKKAGIPLSVARFDPALYTAERFQDDLFGLLPPAYLDIDLFFTLQTAWLQSLVTQLKAQHGPDYAVMLRVTTPDWGGLKLRPDPSPAATRRVFTLNPDTGEITEFSASPLEVTPKAKGTSALPSSAASTGGTPGVPQRDKTVAKALSRAAAGLPEESRKVMHRERLAALSSAVASSNTGKGLKQAMALTLLALERSPTGGVPAIALKVEGARRVGEVEPRTHNSPLEHFQSLLDLPQAEFQARYTEAVALTLRDTLTQGPDVDLLLQALGRRNNLGEAYYTLEASYLTPMTKDALLDFALTLPLEVKLKRSDPKPALIAALLEKAPALRAMNWMPEGFAPPPGEEAQGSAAPAQEAPAVLEGIAAVQPSVVPPPAPVAPVSAPVSVAPSVPSSPPWTRTTVLPIRPSQDSAVTPHTAAQLSAGWPAVSLSSLPPLGLHLEPEQDVPEDDADTWFSNNPLPSAIVMNEHTHRAAP